MAVQTFECIPGTYGERIDNRTIKVTGSGLSALEKKLTVPNKAVIWEVNKLKKSLASAHPAKKEGIQKKIEELLPERFVQYFAIMDSGDFMMPSGFWYLCEKISDKNVPPAVEPVVPGHARPYQREAIELCCKTSCASICLFTGAGKSLIIKSVAESFIKAGKRVCVIVPTIDLVKQTVDQMKDLNSCGAGGTYKYKTACDVLVSTPITAAQYVDRFQVLIIDEAAHTSATTWFRLGLDAKQAEYRFGFTATYMRGDGLELGIHAWCGPILISRDAKWGIDNKWLTPTDVTMINIELDNMINPNLMAAVAYKINIKRAVVHHCIFQVLKKLLDGGQKVMLLMKTIVGAELLAKFCAKKGIVFQVAHAQYRAPFYQFKKGEIRLLCGTDKLLGEGIDVPDVTAVINVCNTASEGMCRQIVGRAVRLFPDKEKATIIDIYFSNYDQFARAAESRRQVYETITDKVKHFTFSEDNIRG